MASVVINHIWDKVKFDRPRQMVLLAETPGDIRVALNCYQPGAQNELHYHVGTGQTFLVLRGRCLLRYKPKEQEHEPPKEVALKEGDSILIPPDVYYQMRNPGPENLVLYQAKQPGEDQIVVHGKGKLDNRAYFTPERETQRAL